MGYTSNTTAAEVAALLDGQRDELLAAIGTDPSTWSTPSLCAGWTVCEVVSHLLMPYEMTKLTFVQRMLRSKGSFDRVANDWVERDRRTPGELVAAMKRTATVRFNVPGSPLEAPLSHLLIHSEDIYRPLGHARRHDPRSLTLALDQLLARGPRSDAARPARRDQPEGDGHGLDRGPQRRGARQRACDQPAVRAVRASGAAAGPDRSWVGAAAGALRRQQRSQRHRLRRRLLGTTGRAASKALRRTGPLDGGRWLRYARRLDGAPAAAAEVGHVRISLPPAGGPRRSGTGVTPSVACGCRTPSCRPSSRRQQP